VQTDVALHDLLGNKEYLSLEGMTSLARDIIDTVAIRSDNGELKLYMNVEHQPGTELAEDTVASAPGTCMS
jgi:hypothetical protein